MFPKRMPGRESCDNGRERMANSGTVRNILADGSSVEEALQRAAMAARREYVRSGLSMPVWRGGRLVWVKPTELEQYDADGHRPAAGTAGTSSGEPPTVRP
jgi:hypothetical protein